MVRSNSQLGKLRLEDVYLSQGHMIEKSMGQFSDSNYNVSSLSPSRGAAPPSEVLLHQPPIIITIATALLSCSHRFAASCLSPGNGKDRWREPCRRARPQAGLTPLSLQRHHAVTGSAPRLHLGAGALRVPGSSLVYDRCHLCYSHVFLEHPVGCSVSICPGFWIVVLQDPVKLVSP